MAWIILGVLIFVVVWMVCGLVTSGGEEQETAAQILAEDRRHAAATELRVHLAKEELAENFRRVEEDLNQ